MNGWLAGSLPGRPLRALAVLLGAFLGVLLGGIAMLVLAPVPGGVRAPPGDGFDSLASPVWKVTTAAVVTPTSTV